ncbi:MAG: signal peptidase I [Erythrobacter sp.]
MDVHSQYDNAVAEAADSETTGDLGIGDKGDAPEKEESWLSFAFFLLKLILAVLIFRSLLFSPFSIPSESMQPRLWNGDYLLASKWSYGFSNYSLPFNAPLIPGRIFADQPDRGDVVIFKHPIDKKDYIKRAIGLPGDTIEVVGGQVMLNGELIPREPIVDFVQPVDELMLARQSENKDLGFAAASPCGKPKFEEISDAGVRQCRYPRYRETLPSGVSYNVLDFGPDEFLDDFDRITVGEGDLFVMGDNRDNSLDSRAVASPDAGVGIVSQDLLVGEATIIMWSTDGGAVWYKPWTWFSSTRWGRIGDTL